MQLTVTAPQHVKDKAVVDSDPLLSELKEKKADEVSTWVDVKTVSPADTQKLLKSLALAVNNLLKK